MKATAALLASLALTGCTGFAESELGAVAGFTFCTFAGAALIYQNLKRQS